MGNTAPRMGTTSNIKANLSQNTTTSADSGPARSVKKPSKHDIVVHQSIEMTSVAVEDDIHTKAGSRDGSENNLVTNGGWRADAFASGKRKSEYGRRVDAGNMV
jgi:hypothetical protein